ncbi:porimin [Ammospiza nelsoni]|uniref:porimin n=1 Tax=Ammospiza nelsoni TaxID=2857394 RepID=UPI0028699E14|nr:porimin [Ammospiza nelsoni]
MRLLGGSSCALWALLLLACGSLNEGTNGTEDVNSTTPIPGSRLPDNSSSPSATASSTQSTATPTGGVSSSTTHVTNTSQPNTTTTPTSVILTIQPTKTSQTVTPTTASAVTSPQGNATVGTTSKTSSTSVTATSKSEAVVVKTSRFDVGSFVGGIVLTLGVLVILYIGCKTYHSRRGIQYRTIDEHDAII